MAGSWVLIEQHVDGIMKVEMEMTQGTNTEICLSAVKIIKHSSTTVLHCKPLLALSLEHRRQINTNAV